MSDKSERELQLEKKKYIRFPTMRTSFLKLFKRFSMIRTVQSMMKLKMLEMIRILLIMEIMLILKVCCNLVTGLLFLSVMKNHLFLAM